MRITFVPTRSVRVLFLALALPCLGAAVPAWAAPISITIDTSALAGTSAQLAFDLVDGNGPSSAVTVTSFSTDGVVGTTTTIGGAAGSLASGFTLNDSSFFNELLSGIVLGNTISFTFDTTGPAGAPPDQFSVFLLDAAASLPLFATDDPTGANALFAFDLLGADGLLTMFTAPGGEVQVTVVTSPVPVPEPATLTLSALGLALIRARGRARRRAGPRE